MTHSLQQPYIESILYSIILTITNKFNQTSKEKKIYNKINHKHCNDQLKTSNQKIKELSNSLITQKIVNEKETKSFKEKIEFYELQQDTNISIIEELTRTSINNKEENQKLTMNNISLEKLIKKIKKESENRINDLIKENQELSSSLERCNSEIKDLKKKIISYSNNSTNKNRKIGEIKSFIQNLKNLDSTSNHIKDDCPDFIYYKPKKKTRFICNYNGNVIKYIKRNRSRSVCNYN